MSEEQRAAFEKHAKEVLMLCVDIGVDGEYESNRTRENFLTWQAALSAKSVPDGYVLVPIEPTEDMKWKGAMSLTGRLSSELEDYHDAENACNEVAQHYKAMLAASPPLPTDDERVRVLDSTIITAMKDGYRFFYHEPASYLTDEANTELAWGVERSKAPYCGKDGIRYWSGANPLNALEKCKQAIASMSSGEQG